MQTIDRIDGSLIVKQDDPKERLNMRPGTEDGLAVSVGGSRFHHESRPIFYVRGRAIIRQTAEWLTSLSLDPAQPNLTIEDWGKRRACFMSSPAAGQLPILEAKGYRRAEDPAIGSDFGVPPDLMAFVIAELIDDDALALQFHEDVLFNHNLVVPNRCAYDVGELALRWLDETDQSPS